MKTTERRGVRLLPRELLVKTNPLDQGDWVYRPVLGEVERMRFRVIASMLRARPRAHRLLEVGYGSGILLPELARACDELHGIDVHPCAADVARQLDLVDVKARLLTGDACALPYRDASFDVVVIVSAMEFVPDVAAAAREAVRVLTPEGVALVVTPGNSAVLDLGLKILTGERAEDTFEGRRAQVVPSLRAAGDVVEERLLPRGVARLVPVYRALAIRRRSGSAVSRP
ncbi:MAG: class I SAM-dependent methyltransferase [Actinobacteria bacterium]|nr:class I SAM-dependent methyltransferase [Actinomycetota bacterium]